MTDRKGATAPGFQRDYDDASSVTHEEWLWLAEFMDKHVHASRIRRRAPEIAKYRMAAAGLRLLHEQTREPGDG